MQATTQKLARIWAEFSGKLHKFFWLEPPPTRRAPTGAPMADSPSGMAKLAGLPDFIVSDTFGLSAQHTAGHDPPYNRLAVDSQR